MPLNVTTKYTKERILRFNHAYALSRKFILIFMAADTLLMLLLNIITAFGDTFIKYALFLVLALDLLLVFMFFGLPYLLVGKNKAIDAVVEYVFDDEEFTVSMATEEISQTSTAKYTTLFKVLMKGSELYLFIAPRQAYIVDLSVMEDSDIARLKGTINKFVAPKKFKWR